VELKEIGIGQKNIKFSVRNGDLMSCFFNLFTALCAIERFPRQIKIFI